MLSVTGETTVQVIVLDKNTYSPSFGLSSYSIEITEGLGVGSVIPGLNVGCRDIDQASSTIFSDWSTIKNTAHKSHGLL